MGRNKYKQLYKQARADLDLCRQQLQHKTVQFNQANREADALAAELLLRMAPAPRPLKGGMTSP